MTDSPLRAKGRAMRRNLMGAAYADKLDRQLYTDPIMEKFAALTQETVFGTLWTRPGLDLKTRTLICVASDTATSGAQTYPAAAVSPRAFRRTDPDRRLGPSLVRRSGGALHTSGVHR